MSILEPTGVALINVDQSGLNQITVAPGANNYVDTEIIDQAFQVIPSHATILLQLEIPIDSVQHAVKLGRTKNCRLILDPAPAQRLSTTIFKNISLITPNTSEAAALTGFSVTDFGQARKAADKLQELGCEQIILTLERQELWFNPMASAPRSKPHESQPSTRPLPEIASTAPSPRLL